MDVQMNTGDIIFGKEEEGSNIDEESLQISKDMVSFTVRGEALKSMILNESDADMMKKLFQDRLRSGEVEN